MLWRHNLSIRQKLQGIVMTIWGAALVVATAVFTFYDRATFLSAKTDDLVSSARLIGANSTAALAFGDPNSAREILSALQAKQHIMNACIYDSAGKVLAKYSRDPTQGGFSPPAVQRNGSAVAAKLIVLFENIVLHGDCVSTIFLEADLSDPHDRLQRFEFIDFVV